jgi:hypothetical protein
MAVIILAFGLLFVGCPAEEEDDWKPDNNITSVSISLYLSDETPKVGNQLTASAKNISGSNVSNASYQWKRGDSQYSTFVNINDATSNRYTPTTDDSGKYLRVEARNNDTFGNIVSNTVGPVDGNQVAKPTADPNGGEVVSGQEITLSSTTDGYTVIYYTLDGTTPTTSSTQYSSYPKLTITNNCTLKAIATRSGMVASEVLSVSYTVVAAPAFSAVTSSASVFTGGIYSVAYGNNRFVAGGNTRMAYSTNGTTWTDSTGNSNFLVNGITYGTQFIAVGYGSSGGIINYSSDGASWNNVTDTTFGTSRINGVAYGGGRYVAVGRDGKIASSTNGTSWTTVTDFTFGTSDINSVTYGAGKFVAVGASGKMAYSTNGTSWTAVSYSTFSTSTINGITYGGTSGKEKFIAVGNSGLGSYQISYSSDGVTWTRVSQSFYDGSLFDSLNRVAWGGNKFVAVAGRGVMYYSLDGTYWAKIEGGTGTGKSQFDATGATSSINDIVYGGGKFLAVGNKYVNDYSSTGEMSISN